MGSVDPGSDLIIVSVPGVQRYIAESRTTGDLVSASEQVSSLVYAAAEALISSSATVVFPTLIPAEGGLPDALGTDRWGLPNRVVALAPNGAACAEAAAAAVQDLWRSWVGRAFAVTPAKAPSTPGFPPVSWVVVPAGAEVYQERFARAQQAMVARRRARSFSALPIPSERSAVCSLSGRWLAEPPPRAARFHEAKERLSAVNWVKRLGTHRDRGETRPGAPSTYSIASAPYRAFVLELLAGGDTRVGAALVELYQAVPMQQGREIPVSGLPEVPDQLDPPVAAAARWLREHGGPWVDPDRWTTGTVTDAITEQDPVSGTGDSTPGREHCAGVATTGRKAAAGLQAVVSKAGGPTVGVHLALVLQDLDSMGRYLGGEPANGRDQPGILPSVEHHRSVSSALRSVAAQQAEIVTHGRHSSNGRPLCGVLVYAGGDDLLALAPASTALDLVEQVHQVTPEELPTASTAVAFFHQHSSLQGAVRFGQELLDRAKHREGKHGLAVGYVRRSGTTHATVQPWVMPGGRSAASLLAVFAGGAGGGYRLSPRLVADLERDRDSLAQLAEEQPDLLELELRRLVARHCGEMTPPEVPASVAAALVALGTDQPGGSRAVGIVGGAASSDVVFDPVPACRVGVFLRQECQ